MPTAYHRRVQASILEIGRGSSKIKKVWNDRRPLHIVHPTRSKSLLYYPDARFVTRSGKFWLFEVLDSETGSQAQMIAHIVEPLLVDGVLAVVHVVKTHQEQEVLEDLTTVILARMTDLIGRKVDSRIRYFRVVISPSDSRRTARIQRIFSDGGIRF
ncbi:MAG TPA: hypothetical protein VGS23_00675 [Thermoplasmata archaeon]|nr:hypothetical protein [Thermoplasmata archaeon]